MWSNWNFHTCFFHFFKNFTKVQLIYSVVILSSVQKVIQLYMYKHSFCVRFFSHIDYRRTLGRGLCNIQQVPAGQSFQYCSACMCQSPTPTPFLPTPVPFRKCYNHLKILFSVLLKARHIFLNCIKDRNYIYYFF